MTSMFKHLQNLETALNGYARRLQITPSTQAVADSPNHTSSPPSCPRASPRDTVIVNDRSGSMSSRDYRPSRLAGGVKAATAYINARLGQCSQDRVALAAFNDTAKTLVPLTLITERERLLRALDRITATGGTDIGSGLKVTMELLDQTPTQERQRHLVLLTDGHGGSPVAKADCLKRQYEVVIDVVGIGGTPDAVNESLLRAVATTEPDGFNHYRFIKDSHELEKHYQDLATGLIWRGKDK